jgi:hypothetical protein
LDSREVSGKSEEEGALDEEETPILHPAHESHRIEAKSPGAIFEGDDGSLSRMDKELGFVGPAAGLL